MTTSSKYSESGVDIAKGDELVDRLKKNNSSIGGFAGLYMLDERNGLVACTDGIGTKIEIGIRFDAVKSLGQDLVAMCVNDLAVTGAKPLFFLDYFATSKLDVDQAENFINGVREAAESVGAVLLGGETAEMPGFYGSGHFDAAGFSVGQVTPEKLVDGHRIQEGDVVVALPSSGFHSNGYSLIRKLLGDKLISENDIAESSSNGKDRTWKEVLVTPTALYVNDAKKACDAAEVRGMAHITGGGLSNIDRVLPEGLVKSIDTSKIKTPSYMTELAKKAGMDFQEASTVWNMGVGYVFVVPASDLSKLQSALPEAYQIGKILKS